MGVIPTRMFPLGVGHGAPLPYDAEVEYLDSTGLASGSTSYGPYINTGIVPDADDSLFVLTWTAFRNSSRDSYNGIAGFVPTGASGANSRFVMGMVNNSPTLYWGISNLNLSGSVSWQSGKKIENQWIHMTGTTATYGYGSSASFSTSITRYNNTYKPILLFGRNAAATPTVNPEIHPYQKTRIYSARIENSGSVVRDFIAVRVGQVGYLYDKVSQTLFGNDGESSFELGPDKT